eukprot:CAMPEP_0174738962 /NCGR_PEP_ID=MMETSP1094-20130205/70772_1 /TAXON_ID=156173 /ORGANISM="Chrysochromulina brevifilum, Strain UTEX LB 985" /LENGTH=122 /DNA_ID=CAMNT_0015942467 /DNA_START=111 /DNA_END=480 /DNA_ORIENTATION=+
MPSHNFTILRRHARRLGVVCRGVGPHLEPVCVRRGRLVQPHDVEYIAHLHLQQLRRSQLRDHDRAPVQEELEAGNICVDEGDPVAGTVLRGQRYHAPASTHIPIVIHQEDHHRVHRLIVEEV